MIRIFIAGSLLLASIYAAHAINFGHSGVTFGKLGVAPRAGTGAAPPPPGCAVPDAPDGAVDLSKCSNAFYIAVIF